MTKWDNFYVGQRVIVRNYPSLDGLEGTITSLDFYARVVFDPLDVRYVPNGGGTDFLLAVSEMVDAETYRKVMGDFEPGDRVRVARFDGHAKAVGTTGTVLGISPNLLYIECRMDGKDIDLPFRFLNWELRKLEDEDPGPVYSVAEDIEYWQSAFVRWAVDAGVLVPVGQKEESE